MFSKPNVKISLAPKTKKFKNLALPIDITHKADIYTCRKYYSIPPTSTEDQFVNKKLETDKNKKQHSGLKRTSK